MREVLHITTHMGGGVGKVLSGVAAYAVRTGARYRHRILLLEQPEKMNFIDACRAEGVEIICGADVSTIESTMRAADVVQIEWWHHPQMAAFLADFPQIDTHLTLWAHVSGCYYPYIPPAFLRVPQRFVFTSPYSLDNPYWSAQERRWGRENTAVVHSSGGFSAIRPHTGRAHDGRFVIGYVGTQSYAKLHPNFVAYCARVAHITGIEFVLVGDLTNEEAIRTAARAHGIEEKFRFVDYVSDVNAELARMDVFGYLLNPTHFGTTENALLEAMAAELPVVVLNQCAEQYLVAQDETGLLVQEEEGYRRALEDLFAHPEKRRRLGGAARRRILRDFSVERTTAQLHEIYDEVLNETPRRYDFRAALGRTPHEFFLRGLPDELRSIFVESDSAQEELPPILRERSKSSLPHFCRVFPVDEQLRRWREQFCNV